MYFLKPMRLLLLTALIFIILIYLHKKKLKEIEVPSITFWEKAFNDKKNENRKKINKYVLLILDCIIGMLMIFSFSEPYISKNKSSVHASYLRADASVSKTSKPAKSEDKKNVLFVGENSYLEKAVSVLPYVNLIKSDGTDISNKKVDFYIINNGSTKNVPKGKPVWYTKPGDDIIKKSDPISGNMILKSSQFSYGMNNMKFNGEGYELNNNWEKADELISIDYKPVMYINSDMHIYSSVNWDKSSMVLSPAFPVFIDNIIGYCINNEENYEYSNSSSNGNKDNALQNKNLNYSADLNINLKNVFIAAALILLAAEWMVFKVEYKY